MKQPFTLIPPAQAEALYDAALQDERRGTLSPPTAPPKPAEVWDDGPPSPMVPAPRRSKSARFAETPSPRFPPASQEHKPRH